MVLASDLKDLPQAIARLRQVSASSPRYVEARRLEARWRADLGDIAGASLSFGRMREAIELSLEAPPNAAQFLLEASEFEHGVERDVRAAERHLEVAPARRAARRADCRALSRGGRRGRASGSCAQPR